MNSSRIVIEGCAIAAVDPERNEYASACRPVVPLPRSAARLALVLQHLPRELRWRVSVSTKLVRGLAAS